MAKIRGAESATPSGVDVAFTWTRAQVIALTVLCMAQLLEAVDSTVVNVSLPTIKRSLGFSQLDLPWVVNAYTVVFGGFMLLGGRAGDLLGHRRVFLSGTALFTLASLGCGLAQDGGQLIVARCVQGLAAGFVGPLTLGMIAFSVPEGRQRNKAVGIWGAVAAVSGVLGLILGGALSSGPGWRWIFFVNVPFGIVMLCAWKYLAAPPVSTRQRREFDVVGAVTATGGVGLLAYAVVQTDQHGWGSGATIGMLIGAAALLGYFVVHEAVVATNPLVPLSLFKNRSVTGANIVMALANAAIYLTFLFASLYMQQVLHYSPLKTGLAYLPLSVSMLAFAGLGPVLVSRIGIRFTLAIGLVVSAAGLFLFSRMSPTGGVLGDIIVPSLLLGPGGALMFIPVTIAAETGVSGEQHGVAAGLINVSRMIGGALGIAVLSTVATARTTHLLHGGYSANTALSDGFRLGFAAAAGLMLAAAVFSVLWFRDEGRVTGSPPKVPAPRPAGDQT